MEHQERYAPEPSPELKAKIELVSEIMGRFREEIELFVEELNERLAALDIGPASLVINVSVDAAGVDEQQAEARATLERIAREVAPVPGPVRFDESEALSPEVLAAIREFEANSARVFTKRVESPLPGDPEGAADVQA